MIDTRYTKHRGESRVRQDKLLQHILALFTLLNTSEANPSVKLYSLEFKNLLCPSECNLNFKLRSYNCFDVTVSAHPPWVRHFAKFLMN